MLIATGDTHGNPVDRLNPLLNKCRSGALTLTKEDIVIILGDFGAIWKQVQDQKEASILNWLDAAPWTTAFICGNHENFDRFEKFPIAEMFGGKVGVVGESIFHLRRGEIYTLDGWKVFTFGGAASIDKPWRQEGLSWWPQEIPSKAEEDHALANLEKHGNKVDIIMTHTMPLRAVEEFKARGTSPQGLESLVEKAKDPVPKFLDHIFDTVEFDAWLCGHFHVNELFCDDRILCLYGDVVVLDDLIEETEDEG